MDGFFADLGEAYNKAVAAFGAAGCRYLQLDEVNIAYLCDPEQIAGLKARGEHVENLLSIYAGMLNRAIEGKPDGMAITMHLCRGNFRSHWVASGGYEPVAEVLFNQINADAYFMEYDSDRAGGFEPLRFVPRGNKVVVLGLVTSKTGALETKDELKRRIDRGGEISAAGAACAVAAMRLRQHRGRQHADRGGAVGEAAAVRRGGARGLGRRVKQLLARALFGLQTARSIGGARMRATLPPLAGGDGVRGPRHLRPPPPTPVLQGEGDFTWALLALIVGTTALRIAFGAALGLGRRRKLHGRVRAGPEPRLFRPSSGSVVAELGRRTSVRQRGRDPRAPAVHRAVRAVHLADVPPRRRDRGCTRGLWAAVLLNLSPVFGVTTGTWVLPDGPLDCALLGAALCLLRALERGDLGLVAGNRPLCRAGAVLEIFGGADASAERRSTCCRAASTGIGWRHRNPGSHWRLPCWYSRRCWSWNAEHGWASFAFQGARAAGLRFRPLDPLVTLAGEALFVLPWIWLPMMAVFVAAVRRGPGAWRSWLLCCLAAPPIVVFALVSAWSSQRVLFHWAAPGYLMLFPLLGDAVARRLDRPAVRRLLVGTAVFVVLAVAVVATQVRFDWLHPALAAVTRTDPDIDAIDWTSLRDELETRDLLPPGTIVGVPNWRDAGKVAYALGPEVTTLCLNRDARQFGIAEPPTRFLGADVLILAPEHGDRVPAELGGAFDAIERLPDASVTHAGRTLLHVAVFRGRRLHAWPPSG